MAIKRFFALCACAFLILLIIQSCQKETIVGKLEKNTTLFLDHNEVLSKYQLMLEGGLDIRSGGQLYSIDDAIALMNSSLNVAHCRAGHLNDTIFSFVDTLTVSLTNDSVAEQDLFSAMYSFAVIAGNMYESIIMAPKWPVIFDIRLASDPNGQSVQLEQRFISGSGGEASNISQLELDWWYGEEKGRCSTGINKPWDASSILERELRYNLVNRPAPGPGGIIPYAFTERYSVCFIDETFAPLDCDVGGMVWLPSDAQYHELSNPNDPIPDDNRYEALLYYERSPDPNYDECLDEMEMDFHLHAMTVLTNSQLPEGFEIFDVHVGYEELWFPGVIRPFHAMRVDYAKLVDAPGPPQDLPD